MGIKRILLITFLFLSFATSHAQDKTTDSLKHAYYSNPQSEKGAATAYALAKQYDHIEKYDSALHYADIGIALTKKLKLTSLYGQLLRTVGNIYNSKSDYAHAEAAYQEALEITDTTQDKLGAGKLLNNLGVINERKGEYTKAYHYFQHSLDIFIKLNSKKDISAGYNNIALIYQDQGNNGKSIEYNLKAVKIEDSLNQPFVSANTLNNIGSIYREQKDDKQALEYYMKSLDKYQLAKSKQGIASINGNVGLIYMDWEKYDKALEYFNKDMDIQVELGNKRGVADCYNNMGSAYFNKGDMKNSMENNNKALSVYQAIGDQEGSAEAMNNIGRTLYSMNKFQDALKTEEEALALAKHINSPQLESDIHQNLSEIYEKTNQTGKAYDNYKNFVRLRDSMNSEENTKQLIKAQLAGQFEKEQQAAALQEEKRTALANEAARRQRAILYFVISILVLVMLFAGFMVNRFILIRKQKKTIEIQKSEVESKNKIIGEKNKDITDSINYARDIQRALMPEESEFKLVFPESFVLYMPKDIVSGDFYWMSEKDGKALLLAADCTGHGVPGALMSMIGVSLFNETVEKKDIIQPGSILNEVRTGIMQTFRQKGEGQQQHRDGMDAALCSIDLKTLKAEFAGAYNPMWIINKAGETKEIIPDKQPLGVQEGQKPTFTTQPIQLEKGDTLFLFSDGYADQFGGPHGKKFKYKQLQETLLSLIKLPMSEQKAALEKKFHEWKGDLEQVDDVLIIGVRV